MEVKGQSSYVYPVNLAPPPPGAQPNLRSKQKQQIPRESVLSVHPNPNPPHPAEARRKYKLYYRICMTCMFICFVLALICCLLAALAYSNDKFWNHGVRNGNLTILSTAESQRSLREIYGLDWRVKLQRRGRGLVFFLIFTILSAIGYLFHVWIYHVDLRYYRTTVTIFIHIAGVIADVIAVILMVISIHSQDHAAKDLNTEITEYYGSLAVPRESVLLVRPGFSYFYYCPLAGDPETSEKTQLLIRQMGLCQDATTKILALFFLIVIIILYLIIIGVSIKWKTLLQKVEPIPDQEAPLETEPAASEAASSSQVQSEPKKRDGSSDALAAENVANENDLPKLGYLSVGFDPPASYISPPDDEPTRPQIVHVSQSSAHRLLTMADKIKNHTV